tara:strand:+ start:194 stop:649 length:456 start_codon:yes stop_codon:yes gene_type:complete
MKKTVIFDLDGTLALIDVRKNMSLKKNGRIDWKVFHKPEHIVFDKPNEPVIQCANMYYDWGYNVVILSGRPDTTEKETRKWLQDYMVPWHKLIMRPHKTRGFTSDEVLKEELLKKHLDINDIFCIFDDRQKVVDMWRSLGLTCFQVAPGDF